MLNKHGDLFNVDADAVCITTNGFVTVTRKSVMGRGCAAELKKLWPEAPAVLGEHIIKNGNVTQVFGGKNIAIVAFPVKKVMDNANKGCTNIVKHAQMRYLSGACVPGFHLNADMERIQLSALQLVDLADEHGWESIALPRPGCGAGELDWKEVEPMLQSILDDRFTSYTFA